MKNEQITVPQFEEMATKQLVIRGREFYYTHQGRYQRLVTIRLYSFNQKLIPNWYGFGEVQYSFPGSWNMTDGSIEGVSCHPVVIFDSTKFIPGTESELKRWKDQEPLWLLPKSVVFTRGIERNGGGHIVPSADIWFVSHLMRLEMFLRLVVIGEGENISALLGNLDFMPPIEFLTHILSQLQTFISQQLKTYESVHVRF